METSPSALKGSSVVPVDQNNMKNNQKLDEIYNVEGNECEFASLGTETHNIIETDDAESAGSDFFNSECSEILESSEASRFNALKKTPVIWQVRKPIISVKYIPYASRSRKRSKEADIGAPKKRTRK